MKRGNGIDTSIDTILPISKSGVQKLCPFIPPYFWIHDEEAIVADLFASSGAMNLALLLGFSQAARPQVKANAHASSGAMPPLLLVSHWLSVPQHSQLHTGLASGAPFYFSIRVEHPNEPPAVWKLTSSLDPGFCHKVHSVRFRQ